MAKRNRAGRLATGLVGIALALPLGGCEKPGCDKAIGPFELFVKKPFEAATSKEGAEKLRKARILEEKAYKIVRPYVEEQTGEEYENWEFSNDFFDYCVYFERAGEYYRIDDFATALNQDETSTIGNFWSFVKNKDEIKEKLEREKEKLFKGTYEKIKPYAREEDPYTEYDFNVNLTLFYGDSIPSDFCKLRDLSARLDENPKKTARDFLKKAMD
ncbi:hypothetical protein GF386_05870 [Candidatus Pacearchaeota archaeon]|nr:hypothetical protein [Candidatus Pacearchaeota archaeon]MBD3283620.1 hypothetical protein [Candidatus Pacearchaeota archaeon]